MMRHRPTLPQRLEMRPQQALSQFLGPGTLIHVIHGPLQLTEPPQWLGERMHAPRRRLLAGQTHVIAQGGWLTLQAGEQAALLLCHAPATDHRSARRAHLFLHHPATAR